MCYFTAVQFPEATGYVDLRPWMDSTPITLSHSSSMQIAVQLFEKLVIILFPCIKSCYLYLGPAICVINITRILNGLDHKERCNSKYGGTGGR